MPAKFITSTVFSFLCSICHAQDITQVAVADTIPDKKIRITPYYDQSNRYATTYVKLIGDSSLLLPNAGTTIINALRGQAPNLAAPAYFSNAVYAGLRLPNVPLAPGGSAVWLVDGVPFTNGISGFLNTNAFEFSSVAFAASANTTSFLQAGTGGSFFLTSKTGEGQTKPLFQFNSYVTKGWWGGGTRLGNQVRYNDWLLSHSISYAQDFGAVDTRVSYNLATRNTDQYAEFPDQHSFKLNMGVNLGKRLNMRLIWDGRFAGGANRSEARFFGQVITTEEEERQFYHQANLNVGYQIFSWMKVTGQLVLAQRDSSYDRRLNSQFLEGTLDDDRKMANLFVSAERKLGEKFQANAFAGVQRTWQNRNEQSTYQDTVNRVSNERSLDQDIHHFSYGASLTYARFLTLSWSQRLSRQALASEPEVSAQDYSAGVSVMISELWKPRFIDFGKVRFSTGKFLRAAGYSTAVEVGYPWLSYRNSLSQGRYYPVYDVETGIEVGALSGRLTVTGNFFWVSEKYLSTPSSPAITYSKKGWEIDARARVFDRGKTSYTLGVNLGTVADQAEQNGTLLTPDILLDPDMRQGFFNLIKVGSLQASLLIEAIKAVSFLETASMTKVRDITLGYRLPQSLIGRLRLKDVFVSASGRNLYTIKSKGSEFESFFFPFSGFAKSISLNLLISF